MSISQQDGDEPRLQFTAGHLASLCDSGITYAQAAARGYTTIIDVNRLAELKIAKAARTVPGLLIPLHRVDGTVWGYQYRPDAPRLRKGRPVKYETPWGQKNHIDVPPGIADKLSDPSVPLWITEGSKKADCGVLQGLCVIALTGVWNWRGTNENGGKTALADWHDIPLNGRRVIIAYDGDVSRNADVQRAMVELARYLTETKGAQVEYLHLPDTEQKTGLDDYLMDGHTVEDLWQLVKPNVPGPQSDSKPSSVAPKPKVFDVEPVSLDAAHKVFRKWLGENYDGDTLDAMLAAAAAEQLPGEPVWLLIVSGSGNAKTETVQALDGIGATVTSTLTSDAALLSATPERDRAKGSTGGLLRKIGDRGVLVIKDVTSILTMNRDIRARVLAALREIYDGRWYREVGTDGGRTIPWEGRITVIGAVTTAWDTAHSVIATMGDRFVLVRADSTKSRRAAGRQAIRNTGSEITMRAELATAVAGVLAGMDRQADAVTEAETETLLAAADLVTLARTGVEYDYRGDVIEAHAPEMPTRFAKQLAQILRGAVAIGMGRVAALRLAMRCARDSMPPLRLAIIDYLAEEPDASTTEVRKALSKPRNTIDRQLQALHMLGVLDCREEEVSENRHRWYYSLADGIEPTALTVPEMSLNTLTPFNESVVSMKTVDRDLNNSPVVGCDKSGTGDTGVSPCACTTTPNGQNPAYCPEHGEWNETGWEQAPGESARIRQNILDGYDR